MPDGNDRRVGLLRSSTALRHKLIPMTEIQSYLRESM
jgi:hypothetical protein